MRLRPLCVVLMLVLVPTTAQANDHVASIFGALSMLTGSTHLGGHGSVEVALPIAHPIHDDLGLLVDSSVHGGTDDGTSITKATLMFGLRGLRRPHARLILFAHFLGGFHRSQIGAAVDNGLAGGAGAGLDILLGVAGRTPRPGTTGDPGWMFRAQADWVRVAGENSARVSFGLGYRFK